MTNPGEFLPSPQPPKKAAPSCWVIGGLGCLIVILLFGALLGYGTYKFFSTPRGKELSEGLHKAIELSEKVPEAGKKIADIQGAIARYNLKNGHYPATLTELVPDYLPDPSELHTSLDTNPDPKHISFVYTKPAAGAKPSTVILSLTWSLSFNAAPNTASTLTQELTATLNGKVNELQYQDGKLLSSQEVPIPSGQ